MSQFPKKRIFITGGGTAGHVTPNLALLPRLKAAGFEIHYIGQATGIERQLIEPTGVPFHPISAGKLRRYVDLRNVPDIFRVLGGLLQSLRLVHKLQPDVVFSKGGFVSCPVVWAAWLKRVPVIIHESDLTPGLANKLSAPFAGHICYSFPETAAHISGAKGVYSGIPIREELLAGDRGAGLEICCFSGSKPVLLVMGGSQGAASINQVVRAVLDDLGADFDICHLCGRGGLAAGLDDRPDYRQFEYVHQELPHLLATADLVLSRAGATTLFELLALKKPNLLVPLSLQASRGDQILNAQSFARRGFSRVLAEDDLGARTLVGAIKEAYANRQGMREAMREAGAVNGIETVLELIEACAPGQRA